MAEKLPGKKPPKNFTRHITKSTDKWNIALYKNWRHTLLQAGRYRESSGRTLKCQVILIRGLKHRPLLAKNEVVRYVLGLITIGHFITKIRFYY
jgi:hypothetical protein